MDKRKLGTDILNVAGFPKTLAEAELLVNEFALNNQALQEELDEFVLENDRLKLQLEQKKTQLALVEEKKAETELEMKKQIKFLLEHYLRAKEMHDTSNLPLAFAQNRDASIPEF